MKKKLLLIICISLIALVQTYAQSHTVTGTVTGKDDGLPIPGATVKIKNTTTGTQTGSDGKYSLNVPAGSTIVISFLGSATQQIVVGNQTVVNVALVSTSSQLGEVLVT